MKSFAFLMFAFFVVTAEGATTPESELMVPIRQLSDSFNTGDMKAAAATMSPRGVTIIDEVPPHIWQGLNAFDRYLRATAAVEQAEGISDEVYTPGKPTRVAVNGGDGYVAIPVVYTFNRKGVPMREAANMVYVLHKGASGWVITSFTWVGSTAEPIASVKQQ